jgi:hypothetical protein
MPTELEDTGNSRRCEDDACTSDRIMLNASITKNLV